MPTDGVELMIIIIATFGQALSGSGAAINIFGVLIVWRFLVSELIDPCFKTNISYL
jgi:hypothetical protein